LVELDVVSTQVLLQGWNPGAQPVALGLSVGVSVELAVQVPLGVLEELRGGVSVALALPEPLAEELGVPVSLAVELGVPVSLAVELGVPVPLAAGLGVPVPLAVGLGVPVPVALGEGEALEVAAVFEGVWLGVGVWEGVGVGRALGSTAGPQNWKVRRTRWSAGTCSSTLTGGMMHTPPPLPFTGDVKFTLMVRSAPLLPGPPSPKMRALIALMKAQEGAQSVGGSGRKRMQPPIPHLFLNPLGEYTRGMLALAGCGVWIVP
jgi:hypothetical protein